MQEKFYQNKLYPFQDKVLKAIENLHVDFYLTGGTALSRCYLKHRYSDDLDFFVNDHNDFKNQCNRVITFLKKSNWECDVTSTSDSFVRVFLEDGALSMKIDFVKETLDISSFHLDVLKKGSLDLSGSARLKGPFDLELKGDIPLQVAGLFVEDLADSTGEIVIGGN